MRKIRIGITMSIDPKESLFTNGIRQNIIILRELYEKCPNVEKAYIINTSGKVLPSDPSLPLYEFLPYIIDLKEADSKCDLIITAHGSLFIDEYKHFNKKGIRIVKHMLGPSLSMFTENILFKPNDKAFNLYERNSGTVSAIWFSKHFFDDRYFFESIYECPTKIAPYVWDPRFIEKSKEEYEKTTGKAVLYSPKNKTRKNLGSFEPNLNIVKNCVLPIVIAERFYRHHPQLLENMFVFNTEIVRQKKDLVQFVNGLNINIDRRISFEGGLGIIKALANYIDVVLSHQNGCELNYLYLDAAWLGYPVIHNSSMMSNIGFYYPKNNAEAATQILFEVFQDFDNNYEEYLASSRKKAEEYLITNQEHINNYTLLIEEAMS
jgi:hypothetical protein